MDNVTRLIQHSCPTSRQAVIWYDSCELRYSDFNFFGIPDTAGFSMSNPNQKTSSREPFAVVADLVKAAPLNKPLMFASKALVNDDDNIYALAQCTVDLGVDGCRECLTTILADIKNCCTQWRGWRYLATSCWVSCSDSTFPSNSLAIVESNLNNLLQILTTNAQTSGFYNTTVGENPDQLYGLALCRGDLTPPSNDCNTCLANARGTIIGDCPNNTQGIKWYEKCLMRYSDSSFFGVVDLAGQTLCGVRQISQAASDETIKFARGLVEQASNNPLMVASGEESVTSQSSSYVLLQCTRDLNSEGCKNCLETGLSQVGAQCNQTNGWRYLSGSCMLRYEVFPFFNTSAISTPGSPLIASP
ncbi:cysteine-rich repeat secretory protein 38-like [Asparagus officinalis]|uniref:cysteine-rich repeat secretory protein 38-like n=1 Tax=Asparagus officinalis TaxID=4686 RepID=UPI00098DECBA|nr:cysteine-rich repeat secretory protein 38-like [Asparagus officinalis]